VYEIWTSIVGNVATQPKTAYTKSGLAVTSFRVASSVRRFDKVTREWVNDPPSYVTVTCWRWLAENVASSVTKGQPVVVHGRLKVRDWQTEDGRKGTTAEMEATALGHDLNLGTSMYVKSPARAQPEPAGADLTAEELSHEVSLEPIDLDSLEEPGDAEPDERRQTVAA
jgi:single-strand DNA-binding protein